MPSRPSHDAPSREPGLFSPEYVFIAVGAFTLIFLGAFASLAVTTVMPVVSADLDGERLYALAFAGPLATGVIGMVIAGNWSDRTGPLGPLYTASGAFIVGLLIAGTAPTMLILVVGRLVQGLGTGAILVSLYVVIARVLPPRLHPSIFAAFAAAWVIPSLVGPFAAGAIAEATSWRWVFIGIVAFAVVATIMVMPSLRTLRHSSNTGDRAPWAYHRIGLAVLAAGAVLALDLVSRVENAGPALAVLAAVITITAVKPLLPNGTFRSLTGLPSVILLRGVAAASFFGAEVYLPYFFIEVYDFSPSLAGLALTVGAVSWSVASWLQGRLAGRLSNRGATTIGVVLVIGAVAAVFVTSLLTLDAWIPVVAWFVGGGGMGLMYPRMSVMTLALSNPTNQGFNSSALSISDSLGSALALAITGIILASLSFTGVFGFALVLAVIALFIAPRVEMKSRIDVDAG